MIVDLLNVGSLFVSVFLLCALLLMALRGKLPKANGELDRLKDLEGMVRLLQNEHLQDARRIAQLEQELGEAKERIRFLEGQLSQYGPGLPIKPVSGRPAKPLLLVMCNKLFGEDDALAIRRTGIPFHRLVNAISSDFDRYLQACRQDGTTPWWVQISAHMGEDGIQFADGLVSVTWLSQRIRGLQVLIMAGCSNDMLGWHLVGLARHVIMMSEAIDTTLAQDFSYAFWSRIAKDEDPAVAFAGALAECPQVSEFVQMRSDRRT